MNPMESHVESSWWRRSGRQWALYTVAAYAIADFASRVLLGLDRYSWVSWTVFVLMTFWFIAVSRCRRCGKSVVWQLMRHRPIGAVLNMHRLQACPVCGDDGSPRSAGDDGA